MKETIYKKLKELAKKQETICYSELASECSLPYKTVDERNAFHQLLGEISTDEVGEGRPMLSVLVHHKGDPARSPGYGWFKLADTLKQRKENESDLQMLYRQIKKCWEVWK